MHSRYLFHLIFHHLIASQLRLEAGSNYLAANEGDLRTILIPQPPIGEQIPIAQVLDSHESRLNAERAYRAKLVQLKRGLMEDLLTGRVRAMQHETSMTASDHPEDE